MHHPLLKLKQPTSSRNSKTEGTNIPWSYETKIRSYDHTTSFAFELRNDGLHSLHRARGSRRTCCFGKIREKTRRRNNGETASSSLSLFNSCNPQSSTFAVAIARRRYLVRFPICIRMSGSFVCLDLLRRILEPILKESRRVFFIRVSLP